LSWLLLLLLLLPPWVRLPAWHGLVTLLLNCNLWSTYIISAGHRCRIFRTQYWHSFTSAISWQCLCYICYSLCWCFIYCYIWCCTPSKTASSCFSFSHQTQHSWKNFGGCQKPDTLLCYQIGDNKEQHAAKMRILTLKEQLLKKEMEECFLVHWFPLTCSNHIHLSNKNNTIVLVLKLWLSVFHLLLHLVLHAQQNAVVLFQWYVLRWIHLYVRQWHQFESLLLVENSPETAVDSGETQHLTTGASQKRPRTKSAKLQRDYNEHPLLPGCDSSCTRKCSLKSVDQLAVHKKFCKMCYDDGKAWLAAHVKLSHVNRHRVDTSVRNCTRIYTLPSQHLADALVCKKFS